ncbi:hypothetical protein [Ensifer sp. LC163]|uniref:hypothetical protein n=1 Tax=Ensifer sp. LC163 TaxID=1120652 RepID=UPI000B054644|nr:hypothetical protein [Ensifer sp. LC163]
MSITSPDDRLSQYNPVVPTTEFPANFPVFDNDDIKVFVDGEERDDFAVSGTYTDGVSIDAKAVFAVGVTGQVYVVGYRLPRRTNLFHNGGPLPIRDQNLALSTVESEVQELSREARQAHRAPYGEEGIVLSGQEILNAKEYAERAENASEEATQLATPADGTVSQIKLSAELKASMPLAVNLFGIGDTFWDSRFDKAIDAAAALSNGADIYIPPGEYTLTQREIPANVRLILDGGPSSSHAPLPRAFSRLQAGSPESLAVAFRMSAASRRGPS